MLLKRFAFQLLMVLSGFLLVATIAVLPLTYFTWQQGSFLHEMQAEGVDTKATITSAHVHRDSHFQAKDVTFDIAWTDRNGGTHIHKDAYPGLDYGMQFLTAVKPSATRMPAGSSFRDLVQAMSVSYELTVDEVPIRYLASDPEQFVFSAVPGVSAEDMNGRLPWLLAASVLALVNVPFFIMLERMRKRRKARAATQPGGAAVEEKLDRQGLWILLSLLLYAGLAGIHFLPGVHAYDVKTYGATPFGLPVTAVVIAIGTVLYLPYLWVNWHFVRLARQAGKDGVRGGLFYLLTGGGHAGLLKSSMAVWLGFLYFIVLLVTWINFA